MVKKLMFALAFASVSSIGASVVAQTQPVQAVPVQAQTARSDYADQVVCETQEETGSRLASHKICHTRSQWAQIKRDQRDQTEHTQMQRTMDYNGH